MRRVKVARKDESRFTITPKNHRDVPGYWNKKTDEESNGGPKQPIPEIPQHADGRGGWTNKCVQKLSNFLIMDLRSINAVVHKCWRYNYSS